MISLTGAVWADTMRCCCCRVVVVGDDEVWVQARCVPGVATRNVSSRAGDDARPSTAAGADNVNPVDDADVVVDDDDDVEAVDDVEGDVVVIRFTGTHTRSSRSASTQHTKLPSPPPTHTSPASLPRTLPRRLCRLNSVNGAAAAAVSSSFSPLYTSM
jgi:hypothetical protein